MATIKCLFVNGIIWLWIISMGWTESCLGADENVVPAAKEVTAIEVELYDSPYGFRDVPKFRVPVEDHEQFLRYFSGSRRDKHPRYSLIEIGTARVFLKSGESFRFCWYWTGGKGPLSFSIRGERQLTPWQDPQPDEAVSLDGVLRSIASKVLNAEFLIIEREDALRKDGKK